MIELIKFDPSTIQELKTEGTLSVKPKAKHVTGATKKLWVERFNGSGEVTIEGPVSADLFSQLPLGSIVSHTNTRDLMRVHSHLITGNAKGDPVAKVSGSEIFTFSEGRNYHDAEIPLYPEYIALNKDFPFTIGNTEANVSNSSNLAYAPKNVLFILLFESIGRFGGQNLFEMYDIFVNTFSYPPNYSLDPRFAEVKKFVDTKEVTVNDNIYALASDIMKEFDIGVQVFRNFYSGSYLDYREQLMILVSGGVDRTGDNGVHFKVGTDSVKKYSSLQSNKQRYNSAIVNTTYYTFRVDSPEITNGTASIFDVATLNVDAKMVDQDYESIEEANEDIVSIIAKANSYAKGELNRTNKQKLIVEVDISADNPQYVYREHFNIGDVISIDSSAFFDPQPMRIVEFVESETDGKFESYPVLKSVSDGWEYNAVSVDRWGAMMNEANQG